MSLPQKIENGSFLISDLLQGDDKISKRSDFNELSNEELQESLRLIYNNKFLSPEKKKYLLMHSWKIHYTIKPPNIQEFLTEEWIGPTARSLHPHVIKILCEYWKSDSPYRNLILATSIGTGKTTMSAISMLYIIVHLMCMRDIKRFFGLAQSGSILIALISFTLHKAGQILLQKLIQILCSTEKFRRVNREERILVAQKETPDKLIWTTAGRMGSVQFAGDVHVMLASSPTAILGLDMIAAVLSEISFFLDQGYSSEYIWRMYNDTKGRIQSRFRKKYLTTCILDSSPNDMEESPIDKYIFTGEAYKDPSNYIMTGAHWEYLPDNHPEWQKTGETFPVFKGDGSNPAQVLTETEVEKYNKEDIYNVPIDIKQLFIDNTVKSVKDWCGWPAGSQNKIINDFSIIEKMFDDNLINIYTHIYAPSTSVPEKLIWNQVCKKFFVDINGHYEFYRSPYALRYIHIDQSETGDITGISMCHAEVNKKGEQVYILDFTLAISPNKARINLEAMPCFIEDLTKIGRINLKRVTFDSYQSSMAIQKLKNKGYDAALLSVDRDINPYMTFVAYMNSGRIKAGRNIYLKNNFKSLREVKTNSGKRKIDHLIGKLDKVNNNNNWITSTTGYYAKDISDSACGAVWTCINDYQGIPKYVYEEKKMITEKNKNIKIKSELYNKIQELGYSL